MQQRVIRFLLDQSRKEPEKYGKFFDDYGLFVREGVITVQEQDVKVPTGRFRAGCVASPRERCLQHHSPFLLGRRTLESC